MRILFLLLFSSTILCARELTLEEKVGQVLMTYVEGDELTPQSRELLQKTKLGGILYYAWANELQNPVSIRNMSRDLQFVAHEMGLPSLFIAVDQEGGAIVRMEKGFTHFPGNAAISRTGDPQIAYQAALGIGRELSVVGVNMNLAPVVDVNTNPENPVIGVRSFGSSPTLVAQYAEQAVKGYLDAGILPVLKHFPGHGDTAVDSHFSLPVVNKSLSELDKMELVPFRMLQSITPAIMTAHILFPKIDFENPATMSEIFLQNILRKRLRYEGLIISDSLSMEGVLERSGSMAAAAIEAFEAGCDLLILGRTIDESDTSKTHIAEVMEVHRKMVEAVEDGRISRSRLDESVNRILAYKQNLSDTTHHFSELRSVTNRTLAKEIAERSVYIGKGEFPIDLRNRDVVVVAPLELRDKFARISFPVEYFDPMDPEESDVQQIVDSVGNHELAIVCSYDARKNPQQFELLKQISQSRPMIHIALRDPSDLEEIDRALLSVATLSPSPYSVDAAFSWIQGTLEPLQLPDWKMKSVGHLVWNNEAGQREDFLTFWHKNEEFPSMGIGHFIWPPEDYQGSFENGRFHEVLVFLKNNRVNIPSWIQDVRYCPWKNREEFYHDFDSPRMRELRQLLANTIDLQAKYMVHRFNREFPKMVATLSPEERTHVVNQLYRVKNDPKGAYILVDYLNFMCEGTDYRERYQGKGWGLLQVLQNMKMEGSPSEDFVQSAKELLKRRVANAPKERHEELRMAGWMQRLSTYVNSL